MARTGYKSAKYNIIDPETNKYKSLTGSAVPSLERVIEEKFAPEYNSAELYADDALAESDYSFKKGTLTITVADDDDKTEATFLGLKSSDDEVTKTVDDIAPEIGYGHIVTKSVKGVRQYKAEFFPRVKITKSTTDAKTRGEGVEFGTTTYEGTVFPCDRPINGYKVGDWEKHQTFATEAEAIAFLTTCLTPATS